MGAADSRGAYRCAPSSSGAYHRGGTSGGLLLGSFFAQGDDGLCRPDGLGSASESEVGGGSRDFGRGAHLWAGLEVQPSCSSSDDGRGLRGGQWEPIPFLPYALLRKKWQYHLLTEVKGRWAKSREDSRFIDRLFKENGQGFYVNGESQMTSSRYAARYIGRYIARPALAEHKITSYDGQGVTFWYESHEEKRRVYRRLEAREFIERLIDHIPLKGFKMVRHYGLYARRSKGIAWEILSKCGNFLQQSFAFLSAPAKVLGWRQRLMQTFGQDPLRCPRCGEEMELWRIWHPRYGDLFDLGRDSPGVELFDEQDSAKGKAQGFLEGSRWASQLSLFPV